MKKEKIRYVKKEYRFGEKEIVRSFVHFTIWSSEKEAKRYLMNLQEMNYKDPIVTVEYTANELESAKLLVMSPRKQSIDIENEEEAYIYQCVWKNRWGETVYKHEEQVGILKIKKEPSMKSQTAFWCESTGFSEVFADYRIAKLVQENLLNGVELKKIMLKNNVYSETLYQMTSPYVLSRECICLGYGEEIEKCQICGKEQYFIDNLYQLHLDFSKMKKESDLYVTEKMWGQGIPYPLYIISQRFYQLLKKNKLAGNLNFSPVVIYSNAS